MMPHNYMGKNSKYLTENDLVDFIILSPSFEGGICGMNGGEEERV
jgi:hypothetical protein